MASTLDAPPDHLSARRPAGWWRPRVGRQELNSRGTTNPRWRRTRARDRSARAELKDMVLARQSRLMDITGIGPVVAARILADVGDIARFADRNRFASWTGTATLDASSGENKPPPALPRREPSPQSQDPHRRAHPGPPRAGSPTRSTASSSTTPRPQRTGLLVRVREGTRRVSRIQRGRLSPAHRHFGSATSRTRETDATTDVAAPEDHREPRTLNGLLTTKGSRKGLHG
jgi:predicted flap endonuclease-1-like 5' DNA nuclease